MTAAHLTAPGPASAIRVGGLPTPEPAPDEVLVEVEKVVVDPVDTLVRSGRFRTALPEPFVVGRDLVGTVVQVGTAVSGVAGPTGPTGVTGVTGFRPGDRVWCDSLGHDGRQGSFAEYAVVPAERAYPLPDGVDPEQVVAVAHPAATAYLAWFVHARLRPGETVFVGGAGGNVGRAAVAMAARAGARVLASARPGDHLDCRRLGAEQVLDFTAPDFVDALVAAAPDGVGVFWETSGHHDFALVSRVVTVGARVLVTAAADGGCRCPWLGSTSATSTCSGSCSAARRSATSPTRQD